MKNLRSVLGLLLLASGCASEQPRSQKPLFAVYGDSRTGHEVHRKICRSILESGAPYVISTGDFVLDGDNAQEWDSFREVTREIRSKIGFYPAKGNHDDSRAGTFEKEFNLDRPYYEKVIGANHFFFLDTGSLAEEQLAWFRTRATASRAAHKFAVFHVPPFTVEKVKKKESHILKESEDVRVKLHGLLVELGICAAICGHGHHFYVTRRDGIPYVISAGGGAPLDKIDPDRAEKGDLMKMAYHYILLWESKNGIDATVYDETGREFTELAFPVCRHERW